MQFRFRLARLRRWQSRVCADEKEKVRSALLEVTVRRENLAQARQDFAVEERDMAGRPNLSTTELRAWATLRTSASKRERMLVGELADAETSAERQMLGYMAAQSRLKLIDGIHDRELAEHQILVNRELQEIAQTSDQHARHVRSDEARPQQCSFSVSGVSCSKLLK